jgi:DNA repair protein RecO (recombination protein O)
MPAPRVYQTEAIIIKRTNLGEADRVLTLYTRDLGKIKAVAKGVRRPQSKLGGHVELLTHSRLMLARGRNLDIITQAQTLNHFLPLKEDLERTARGLYVAELVDAFTAERTEDPQLFDLMLDTLTHLAGAASADVVLRYFELHLLSQMGYRPELQYCGDCKGTLQPRTNFFSPRHGGVLCHICGYHEPSARPLTVNALKVLRFWQNCDLATAQKVKVDSGLATELETVLQDYIRYLLEKQLRSAAWLDRLKQMPPTPSLQTHPTT